MDGEIIVKLGFIISSSYYRGAIFDRKFYLSSQTFYTASLENILEFVFDYFVASKLIRCDYWCA
ncbi:hypothetical protein, partial [Turicimonas muris]|uniref:hypothetical protein n=1 Tax=Turicimonas muris TaxID=1796652 RepID=UPI0025B5D35C